MLPAPLPLRLALLGDSLAHGTGAARPADGLGPRLAAVLSSGGHPWTSRVFAVSGARSADVPRQAAQAAPWRPHLVLVVVGTNDVTGLVPVEDAVADLARGVRSLRSLGAQVLVVPAPDLATSTRVPPQLRDLARTASAAMRRAQGPAVVAAGGLLAPVDAATTAAFARDPALFSADAFHPSSAGYALLARVLAPVVSAAGELAAPPVDR